MNLQALDRYQKQDSLLHSLDPRPKLLLAVLFILSNALLPDGAWLAFGFAWLLVLAANRVSRLNFRFLFIRSLIALPFALAAVTAIFSVAGTPVVSVKVGPWVLTATDAGLIRFASIMLRSWISIQAAIVLTATTRFPDLIHALRHLKIPFISKKRLRLSASSISVITRQSIW